MRDWKALVRARVGRLSLDGRETPTSSPNWPSTPRIISPSSWPTESTIVRPERLALAPLNDRGR
jgi:hypothetical protein